MVMQIVWFSVEISNFLETNTISRISGGFWPFGTTVHRLSSLSQVNAGSADHQYHQQRRRAAAAHTHSATASSSLKRRIIGGRLGR